MRKSYKSYQVACLQGRFYFRLRRPKPIVGECISWWYPWVGPFNSAREAKRQAVLALEKRDKAKGWWWKSHSVVPALWS